MKVKEIANDIKQLTLPDNDEIEITTLGAGAFEGESVVIHFGNEKWGIIDSCKTQEGVILPLFYLYHLGVKFEQVSVIVCTHWHTDHILGLNDIVNVCKTAEFFFPMVGQGNNLLKLFFHGYEAQGGSRVWKEFIGSIKAAGNRADYSYPNCVLYDDQHNTQLVALSPSSKMLEIMERILLNFNPTTENLSQISESILPPNICSTALVLNTPDVHILLGGDLESNRNKNKPITSCIKVCTAKQEKGWCNVIEKSKVLYKDSVSYFKLPHHSSKSGYCDRIWSERIETPLTSVSTVFVNNKGVKLPQQDMLQEYFNRSGELYLTSSGPRTKAKKTSTKKSKLDQSGIPQIANVAVFNDEIGIVCSRKKIGQSWTTKILGTAIRVNQSFVNGYKVN